MTAWLMLHVPAMIDAAPVRATPEPSALAMTSNNPATTGVPAFNPVSAAAFSLTCPAISALSSSLGKVSNASSSP